MLSLILATISNSSIFNDACKVGTVSLVQYYLTECVDRQNIDYTHGLLQACEHVNVPVVEALLRREDLVHVNAHDGLALWLAVDTYIAASQRLLRNEASQ